MHRPHLAFWSTERRGWRLKLSASRLHRVTLRILHQFRAPASADDRLTAEAATTRGLPGCQEAEAYRGLSEPERVAMVQLWDDEDAYASYLTAVMAAELDSLPIELAGRDQAQTEAYPHTYFAPVDQVWTAQGQDVSRRIVWPARGPVRIVIQSCFANTAAEAPELLDNERKTRREPGCTDYAWLHGIDDNRHILLLESWADQRLYDQHWILRCRTRGTNSARQRAERAYGTNGAEFYRQDELRWHYDRWLPTDDNAWSNTVAWPV